MKYMLLIYEPDRNYGAEKDGAPLRDMMEKHMAFGREIGPVIVNGAGLKGVATATTIKSQGGRQTIHDGPFAETKEQLGGYYLIDVPDLDAAIAIAKKMPLYQDGSVEIRPVLSGD